MLKIKLHDIHIHRNECLFRPYVQARETFQDIGIRFVADGNDYDMVWVGDKTFCNKTRPLEDAVRSGSNILLTRIKGDKVLFDGQDSPSLIGVWDVYRNVRHDPSIKALLKNSVYRDPEMYASESIYGRYFWGKESERPELNYSIKDYDPRDITLTGTNWLSTVTPRWYGNVKKDIDVCALFSYPAKENWEFGELTNKYYDAFRKPCIDAIDALPPSVKVAKLSGGIKVSIEQYYNLMMRSKVIIAPFGYGEIAPRDLEAAMFGSILIKNDMSHVQTVPNIYHPFQTYVPCRWDFSDLGKLIEGALDIWEVDHDMYVNNFRNAFVTEYSHEMLAINTYNWLSQIDGYE